MPTYEYECEKCGGRFEAVQSVTDRPLTKHCHMPKQHGGMQVTCTCLGKVKRLLFAVPTKFNGGGWTPKSS